VRGCEGGWEVREGGCEVRVGGGSREGVRVRTPRFTLIPLPHGGASVTSFGGVVNRRQEERERRP